MHKVAVLSDTHGLLRDEVLEQLITCEAILHAGDIGKPEILDKLKEIAPLYVVRGNIDKEKWAEEIPEELCFNLFGFGIYIVHNKKHIRKEIVDSTDNVDVIFKNNSNFKHSLGADLGIGNIDFIITGHSHKYEERQEKEIFFLNPGSCGTKRFKLPVTMAFLMLNETEHKFIVEKHIFSQSLNIKKEGSAVKFPQKDMYKLIKKIIKEMEAGKKVSDIAKNNGVDEELVEQICRIYSTHPGVDVDGILNRMDIWNL